MQCPNCYDEEIHGSGYGRVIKKSHLEMESVGSNGGFEYFQCPRCALTRRKSSGIFSAGIIENVTGEEAIEAHNETLRSAGRGLGTLAKVGAVLAVGAIIAASGNGKK